MYTKHRILKIALGLNEQQYLNAYGNHSILDCTPSCKAWTHGTVLLEQYTKGFDGKGSGGGCSGSDSLQQYWLCL